PACGIINASHPVSGALGLAILGTIATNRPHSLEAAHHSLIESLIGGYHLAFTIGALAVTAGILAALVLLREPRPREPEVVVEPESHTPRQFLPDLERQAA